MTTTRTPINRQQQRISPQAVAVFKRMLQVEWHGAQWRRLHSGLHRALGLRPWEYYAIAKPDEECVHPMGSAGAEWHPQAQRLYRELEQAAKAPA